MRSLLFIALPLATSGWVASSNALSHRATFVARTATAPQFKPPLPIKAVALPADDAKPLRKAGGIPHWLEEVFEVCEKGTVPGAALVLATAVSLTLANLPMTSTAWLGLWATHVGPAIGGHALSVNAWINEGLMAIFFFVVGLEIKQEFRIGSLATIRKAILPCLAALGGMVTPMGIYILCQKLLGMGSLCALTVPMATDIAFAMGILGFFKANMPLSASAFLLTLATVDDLGAILVLATCFASNVCFPFLGGACAIFALLAVIGRKKVSDLRIFGAGGVGLWYCLLRSGVNSDIAGVLAAMCISTRAFVQPPEEGSKPERLTERAIKRLLPFTALGVMPLFALANTAVKLGGSAAGATGSAAAAAAASSKASVTPAVGIAMGLLIGKPLGIFGFTWLADKLGIASMPTGMNNKHLGVVGMLGGIGFTMCLLLTEVALPSAMQTIPKLAVLMASAVAALVSAGAMSMLPKVDDGELKELADGVVDKLE